MSDWSHRVWIAFWCGVAVALRLAVMLAAPEQLTQDRDLYLGIARELREGHGYATPGSDPPRPTAFRPPLYPWMLAAVGDHPATLGGLHLLLSAGMIIAVGGAAYRLASGHRFWIVGPAIVAIDPLLVFYSRQPMTETLCACLSAVLIWYVSARSPFNGTWKSLSGVGLLWGLCLLSRPTYGAVLVIWLALEVVRNSVRGIHDSGMSNAKGVSQEDGLSAGAVPGEGGDVQRSSVRNIAISCLIILTAILFTISPWAIRNWKVLGSPLCTTTHGGYTLWLANNPVYYSEVVEGSDAAVWAGESLSRWQRETDLELDQKGISGEIARDRALTQKARDFIRANPGRFMRACWYRAMSFWGITPSRADGNGQNLPILWAVGGYYLTVWVVGIAALIQRIRTRSLLENPGISTAIALILGFFLVHLVYWTDVRMRAPIMPVIAVLIASAIPQKSLLASGKPDD